MIVSQFDGIEPIDNLEVASLTHPFIKDPDEFFKPFVLKLQVTDVEDQFIFYRKLEALLIYPIYTLFLFLFIQLYQFI